MARKKKVGLRKIDIITLNEATGDIFYSVFINSPYPASGKTSVAEVVKTRFEGKLDKWIREPFEKREKQFAKNNPDKYNELINKEVA